MFGIGSTELLVILVIGVLVFGSNRLPAIGTGLGKAIRDFRKAAAGESAESEPRRLDTSE
jgi:sec-independent protein translocase protein TatA